MCKNACIAFIYSHICLNNLMHLQAVIHHAVEQPVEVPTVPHADCLFIFLEKWFPSWKCRYGIAKGI